MMKEKGDNSTGAWWQGMWRQPGGDEDYRPGTFFQALAGSPLFSDYEGWNVSFVSINVHIWVGMLIFESGPLLQPVTMGI